MAKEESLSSGTQHWSRVPLSTWTRHVLLRSWGPHVSSRRSKIVLMCRKKEVKVGALVIILGDYPLSVSVLYSGQHSKYTIYAPL